MGNIGFILHHSYELLLNVNIGVESAEHCLFRPSNNFLQMTLKTLSALPKRFKFLLPVFFHANLWIN